MTVAALAVGVIGTFGLVVFLSFLKDIAKAEVRFGAWSFIDWCLIRASLGQSQSEREDFLDELRSVTAKYKTDKRVIAALMLALGHALPQLGGGNDRALRPRRFAPEELTELRPGRASLREFASTLMQIVAAMLATSAVAVVAFDMSVPDVILGSTYVIIAVFVSGVIDIAGLSAAAPPLDQLPVGIE